MKPLLSSVVVLCLFAALHGADVEKSNIEPVAEAEESDPQERKERCTTCGGGSFKLGLNSPNAVLGQLQSFPPGSEVHTQQSFEECSSEKGCAGIKVKDGQIVEKFGNPDAFKAAAATDANKEYSFHSAGSFGNTNVPFWWMNENSPFKNTGSFEKHTKSSSYTSSGGSGGLDLSGNPFLNGGYNANAQEIKPGHSQSSFSESSSYNTGNKFGGNYQGYTGSSPSPFTASKPNVNLIQSAQKAEFDYEQQQQQQNIDEAFQGTGNVHAHEHSGGELQQTCAGQGYVCVHKAQCNNGVVNTNGAGILQAKTKKQYCNIKTEICCRIEISSLSGAGGLQGSLGVGSATYSGSGNQGSGLFVSQSSGQESQSSQGGFGAQGGQGNQGSFNSQGSQSSFSSQGSQGGQGSQGFGQGSSFESSSSSSSFGSKGQGSSGSGATGFGGNNFGAGNRGTTYESSSSSFESRGTQFGNGNSGNAGAGNGAGVGKFGATASSNSFGYGATAGGSTAAPAGNRFGATAGGNDAVYKQTSQSNFIETDSFSAGSENAGVLRPGASGSGLKPGIPYLPPVDVTNSGSNVVVSSTAFPVTRRPFVPPTPKPTYLPPVSTTAPAYLPPQQPDQTINTETRVPQPTYNDGSLILDQTLRPRQPQRPPPQPQPLNPNDVPSGCAAALKCTPIEYCSADGVISNTSVVLTRDQEAYRVPLTDCKVLGSDQIGKCCRDPFYTDPWPANQLGQWVQGVFGGNDGKYTPDSRGSGSNDRPAVSRPTTGGAVLNNFAAPTPKPGSSAFAQASFGQGQFGQGGQGQFGSAGQKQFGQTGQGGQYSQSSFSSSQTFGSGSTNLGANRGQGTTASQGSYSQGNRGQFGIGQEGSQGQGSQGQQQTSYTQTQTTSQKGFGQTQGQGQGISQGFGQGVSQGQGQIVSQGFGQSVTKGQGQSVSQGFGQGVSQGQGQGVSQGFGQSVTQGQGQAGFGQSVTQGQGQAVSQVFGQGIRQGQGQSVSQGFGQTVSQSFGQGANQGEGQGVSQGFGQSVSQGFGQGVSQGEGSAISQGFGQGVSQGQGFAVSQGSGFGVENEYSESSQRVFLSAYTAGGQCGLLNGQKPYGNRNDLEVDFAEIPWQAMVLLQTNKSLLCGGVITRPDVVITSASCVEGLDAKNVLIKGGEWKLGIDDEPLPFQIVQVKTILRHPAYQRGSAINDVAILVLNENLRWSKNIYPICLPRAGETLDAFYNGAGECIVTGWGKQVLQAHLSGAIMHSLNISLINPGECQAKLSQDYPHLLQQYDQESCACGQPTNPTNNICRVDIGSALACTTGDNHFVLRGIYSWDSGCQPGNQLAGFWKFDLEWYEWAIGLIETTRFAQYSSGSQFVNRNSGQYSSGTKNSGQYNSGIKGQYNSGIKGVKGGNFGGSSGQFSSGFSQYSSSSSSSDGSGNFGQTSSSPISNSFSASYSEKKVFQSEPKYVTYTTKPEFITYTTKPEYFTYTTKPKLVTYTTKPQIITYETSGSANNPQYVAPGVTFNPTFQQVAGHTHNAQCKCLENGKK